MLTHFILPSIMIVTVLSLTGLALAGSYKIYRLFDVPTQDTTTFTLHSPPPIRDHDSNEDSDSSDSSDSSGLEEDIHSPEQIKKRLDRHFGPWS